MIVFSVIYTVDVSRENQLRWYQPPGRIVKQRSQFIPGPPVWEITETDPEEALEQFGPGAKHRKYVACLAKEDFIRLVREQSLDSEVMPCMGSIGTPTPDGGMVLGIAPAVSFTGHGDGVWQNAYATPFVCRKDGRTPLRSEGMTERDWERLEKVMLGPKRLRSGWLA